jgi:DNA-binding transcriptional MerR regulator
VKRTYIDGREVLTATQAGRELGITPRTLGRWRAAGAIPRHAVTWTLRGRMYDADLIRDLRRQMEAAP